LLRLLLNKHSQIKKKKDSRPTKTEEESNPTAMLPSKSRAGVRDFTLAEKLVLHHCQNRIAVLPSEKKNFEEPNEPAASLATLRFELQERALLDASLACVRPHYTPSERSKKLQSSWLNDYSSRSATTSTLRSHSSSLVDAAKGASTYDESALINTKLVLFRPQHVSRGVGQKLQSSWLSDNDRVSHMLSSSLVEAADVSDGDILVAPATCNDDNINNHDNEGSSNAALAFLVDILGPKYVAAPASRLEIALGPTSPMTQIAPSFSP